MGSPMAPCFRRALEGLTGTLRPLRTPHLIDKETHKMQQREFMSVVYYRNERYFVEAPPKEGSRWCRITNRRLRADPREWPDERESFAVVTGVLQPLSSPPVSTTTRRLPTLASAARSERAKTGHRDIGD